MQTPRLSVPVSIIFDTNVLLSAFVFKKFAGEVYQHCAERHDLYTSEWLLAELTRKLATPKFKLSATVQQSILAQIREDMIVVSPTNLLPANSPDPDDNYVLQAALFANADFLITGDEKHLVVLQRVGPTEIITPRTFYDRFMR